jgi:hypothetical protein
VEPERAGELAEAADARRLPDAPRPQTSVQREPGGLRSLLPLVLPGRPAGQGIDADETPLDAAADPGPAVRDAAEIAS